jgi:TPR repeat protein
MYESKATVTWKFPNFTKVSTLRRLRNAISEDEAFQMLKLLPKQFSLAADSVDQLPSHEFYLENHARAYNAKEADLLLQLSHRIIDNRLLPYVRDRYACPQCRVCVSLVRRYQHGARMSHPSHYDRQAYVTLLVSLTTYGEHFTGGLYVRTLPGSERFIATKVGEAISHQYDLEHGIKVHAGTRYSWILWLQDSATCLEHSNVNWFMHDAYRGDPIALFNLGSLLVAGPEPENDRNKVLAYQTFHLAAKAGYPRAQFKLGNAYFFGEGVGQDHVVARQWYQKAAEQNMSIAAYNLANMLNDGVGGTRDPVTAMKWYRLNVADQFEQNTGALNNLAKLLWRGAPAIQDREEAIRLWKQAAAGGLAVAAANLALAYKMKSNTTEAESWHALYTELMKQLQLQAAQLADMH